MQLKPGQPLLSGKDIGKAFGERVILKRLTFRIMPGDRIGVIGVNGAGKTTFLRIIAGEEKQHEGTITRADGLEIGFVGQEPRVDPDKTVRENIDLALGHIHDLLRRFDALNEKLGEGLDADAMQAVLDEQAEVQSELDAKEAWDIDRRIEVAMEALRCPPAGVKCGILSGGEKRRVALCRVLMQHPDLLILDEPTTGLDPQARQLTWEKLRQLKRQGVTQVLTTHYMEEAAALCDRLVIMDHGRIVAEGRPADLIAEHVGREVVELGGFDNEARARQVARQMAEVAGDLVEQAEAHGDLVLLYTGDGEALLHRVRQRAVAVESATLRRATLEDVFLRLTGRMLRE